MMCFVITQLKTSEVDDERKQIERLGKVKTKRKIEFYFDADC